MSPSDKVARTGDGTAISVKLIHLENKIAADRPPGLWTGDLSQAPAPEIEPGDPPPIFGPREITPIDPPSGPDDEDAISVPDMLHRNHAVAIDTGPKLVAMPARRRSRRNRDFMLLVAAALLSVVVVGAVFRSDMQMVALALFGIVFVTVILAWIMYGVMDRY